MKRNLWCISCWAAWVVKMSGLATAAPLLSDRGFESPPVGQSLGYHLFDPNSSVPGQSPWTFIGSAGLARPGWQALSFSVPEGDQVGFLQGGDGALDAGSYSSGIRQTISGLSPTTRYQIEFRASQPENARSIEPTRVHVLVDGVEVASVLPGPTFELFTTSAFSAPSSGSAVLTFI